MALVGTALLPPVPLSDRSIHLYVEPSDYRRQTFAADVPPRSAALLAVTQRPLAAAAQFEPSGPPAWKGVPPWFVYGTKDKAISPRPAAVHGRPHALQAHGVAVEGASHAVMASHPDSVVSLIVQAAEAGASRASAPSQNGRSSSEGATGQTRTTNRNGERNHCIGAICFACESHIYFACELILCLCGITHPPLEIDHDLGNSH
jgi:hypothetical protein